jgi:hypothetical protein
MASAEKVERVKEGTAPAPEKEPVEDAAEAPEAEEKEPNE